MINWLITPGGRKQAPTVQERLRQGLDRAVAANGEPGPNQYVLLLDAGDTELIGSGSELPKETQAEVKKLVASHHDDPFVDSFIAEQVLKHEETVTGGKKHWWSAPQQLIRVEITGIPAPASVAQEYEDAQQNLSVQKAALERVASQLEVETPKLEEKQQTLDEIEAELELPRRQMAHIDEYHRPLVQEKKRLEKALSRGGRNSLPIAEWEAGRALKEFRRQCPDVDFLRESRKSGWPLNHSETFEAVDAEVARMKGALRDREQKARQPRFERNQQADKVEELRRAREIAQGSVNLAQARLGYLERIACADPLRKRHVLLGTIGRDVWDQTSSAEVKDLSALAEDLNKEIGLGSEWLESARAQASLVWSTGRTVISKLDRLQAEVREGFDSMLDDYERVHNDLILSREELETELSLLQMREQQPECRKAVDALLAESGGSEPVADKYGALRPGSELSGAREGAWEQSQDRDWREAMQQARGIAEKVARVREPKALLTSLDELVEGLKAGIQVLRAKQASGDRSLSPHSIETHLERQNALLAEATDLQDEQQRTTKDWSDLQASTDARAKLATTRYEHADRMRRAKRLTHVLAEFDLTKGAGSDLQDLQGVRAAVQDKQKRVASEVDQGSRWSETVDARIAELSERLPGSTYVSAIQELRLEYSVFHSQFTDRLEELEERDKQLGELVDALKRALAAAEEERVAAEKARVAAEEERAAAEKEQAAANAVASVREASQANLTVQSSVLPRMEDENRYLGQARKRISRRPTGRREIE